MRLIDADELTKAWLKFIDADQDDRGAIFIGYTQIPKIINQQPTVDAVEVVRCKDCRWRREEACPMYHEEWFEIDEGDGYADSDCEIIDNTEDSGFCHKGERRSDEGNVSEV